MRKIRFRFTGKKLACCLDIQTACEYIAKEMKDCFPSQEVLEEKISEVLSWGENAMPGDVMTVAPDVILEPYIPIRDPSADTRRRTASR